MREVYIVGIGQTPVDEHWDRPLRELGAEAANAAIKDAKADCPQALFVGNMLSGGMCGQENLGTVIADFAGFNGIEAMKIEAACASGARGRSRRLPRGRLRRPRPRGGSGRGEDDRSAH